MSGGESRIAVNQLPDGLMIVIGPPADSKAPLLFLLVVGLGGSCVVLLRRSVGAGPSMHGGVDPIVLATFGMALGLLVLTASALCWTLFGREEIIADRFALTIVRRLKWIRWTRSFPLAEVTNIRWRERRVARKGGSYLRRTMAFDIGGKTIELSSQLSYAEANELEAHLRSGVDELRGKAPRSWPP